MELTELIEVVTWSLWVAVGIVVGLVSAGFLGGRRMLAYDLCMGLVGAIAGGWGYAVAMGQGTRTDLVISVLCAFFVSVMAVYVLNLANRPRKRRND